jgi:hypothetical protein
LHKNIPLLVVSEFKDLGGSTRQFNYLIVLTGTALEGYRNVADFAAWGAPENRAKILYRDGTCDGSSPWEIQKLVALPAPLRRQSQGEPVRIRDNPRTAETH